MRTAWQAAHSVDREIVVYCQSGGRSQVAFDQLKSAGFGNLYDRGPTSAW